ncbi:CNT family concentrative nucleoside transporter [Balneicella halophila]|uniref:CNT family concentrative nucleoside transporter n=1 Tax=Balneicella halophila TaxID=1537566 RepID=A0A7L4UQY1_BALHA|nr:nucleoside transporter C-terminal domain-containing protein [Balneicella halophila]PVX52176.1 CNT family concentrative nucleoside transporter [Balneicella halophila]
MKNIFYITISLLLLISCGNKKAEEIDDFTQLQKRWTALDGSVLHLTKSESKYLQFVDGGGMAVKKEMHQKFTATGGLFGTHEINGDWEFIERGDSQGLLKLTYLADTVLGIDSMSIVAEKGQQHFVLSDEQGNQHEINPKDFKLAISQKELSLVIKQLDLENLVLQSDTDTWELSYQPPSLETTFSFISILRGLLGIIALIAIAFLFSTNRKKISWRTVGIGLILQVLLAIGILKVGFVQSFFEAIGSFFVVILDFTKEGSTFLFGGFMDVDTMGFIFAFQVLPTIIFFAALTSLLFYLGIIQKIVYGLAWVMTKLLGISGPESLSVAGNIFLGQTESPLMIKAYLEKMTRSEIMLVMTGGMATLAGGVLAAYIAFLGGDDPVQRLFFAKHLLAASFMAAPGAIIISKILVPETEDINTDVDVPKDKIGSNVLDAISNGTSEGLKLAANVAAMLLVFVALIAMANHILGWFGDITTLNSFVADWTGGQYNQLSLEMLLGYIFAPLMWIIGVSTEDITLVGRLLGEKVIMTEFIGYVSLASLKSAGAFVSSKSILIATYMLCGFANFASIGIQIGGIGTLAPTKRKLLSEFGMRALLAGTLASLLSATLVGMILG